MVASAAMRCRSKVSCNKVDLKFTCQSCVLVCEQLCAHAHVRANVRCEQDDFGSIICLAHLQPLYLWQSSTFKALSVSLRGGASYKRLRNVVCTLASEAVLLQRIDVAAARC
jgi:hypothetical protein